MRVHRCFDNRCRTVIPMDKKYCDEHANRYDSNYNNKLRDKEANSFYQSKQWRQLREYVYQRDMSSDAIEHRVRDSRELIADHIVPLRVDESKRLDANNIWLLTQAQHNKKTLIENKMIIDGKTDVLKHLSKEWWTRILKRT